MILMLANSLRWEPNTNMSLVTNPTINPLRSSLFPKHSSHVHSPFTCSCGTKTLASSYSSKEEGPQHLRKDGKRIRAPRPLIKIATSDGKWHDEWDIDFVLTLRELHLSDLAQDGEQDAKVLVALSIQKHAGFGFSIKGRVVTSFMAKCSSCFSPYSREIDASFDVWVLPSSKSEEFQLPEIGGNDPSVIYVKPGSEADLDTLIKDTVRLTASAKDTCSRQCARSTPKWQYSDGKITCDQRWFKLLEIKDSLQ